MSFKPLMQHFREVEPGDFRVLLAVEVGMKEYEYVPLNTVVAYSNLPSEEALYRIKRIHKLRLVSRVTSPYEGYSLNYLGYDFLALNVLVKAKFLQAIGNPLGLGKEADVYEAETSEGEEVAIKFHRLGRISFRQTVRVRGYTKPKTFWLFRSRASAEREYEALKKLYAQGVSVPKPMAHNRHAVLMGKIWGVRLIDCGSLPKPDETFKKIVRNIRMAYQKIGIIHADLSEYNVLVNQTGSIQIIDWPQYVTLKHPQAQKLLERDIINVAKFFERKFKLKVSAEDAVGFVKAARLPKKVQLFR